MYEVCYQCEVQLVGQDDPTLNIERLIEIDVPYDHDKQDQDDLAVDLAVVEARTLKDWLRTFVSVLISRVRVTHFERVVSDYQYVRRGR